ncbi:hypothetical protein SKAU_G00298280 [Synaphobranchus kaupii]|uniref:Secreted protein n=1 Tax=Synaphobranchus kaupii TaxID=118154 RepID=A0A9Q1EV88_SYNKA|nr:hypothetical protein SKAU_G00298280 [Synaphobranchus kaupii]
MTAARLDVPVHVMLLLFSHAVWEEATTGVRWGQGGRFTGFPRWEDTQLRRVTANGDRHLPAPGIPDHSARPPSLNRPSSSNTKPSLPANYSHSLRVTAERRTSA